MGESISSFGDLRVYQLSFKVQQDVFILTKNFPTEERFALTDQLRRASRAVGANIAEAWHKRRYVAHFVSKLTDADGENAETQHWLHTAKECDYISSDELDVLVQQSKSIGKMLGSMMAIPESFCQSSNHK